MGRSLNADHSLDQESGKTRRIERLGALLIVVVALGGSAAHAFYYPFLTAVDEIGHFDYAYQVWHHQLPDFWEGPVISQARGTPIPVQWVSQHPPLFYLLLAPIVGPLIDAEHMLIAGMLVRGINCLIAVGAALAAYAAGRYVFKHRPSLALFTGLVFASSPWLHFVSGAIYNDTLAVLFTTGAFAVAAQVLRNEPNRWSWLLAGVMLSGAFLTRLAAGLVAMIPIGFMALESLWRGKGRDRFGRLSGIVYAALCGGAVLITSGWFYLRNYRLTGSITGRHSEWGIEHLGRTVRPLREVIFEGKTWQYLLNVFTPSFQSPLSLSTLYVLLLAPLALAAVRLVIQLAKRQMRMDSLAIVSMLVLGLAMVIAMQLVYTTGGGALNPRYLLPVLFPLACLIAAGVVGWKRVGPLLACAWSLMWAFSYGQSYFTGLLVVEGDFPTQPLAANVSFIVMLCAAFGAAVSVIALRRLEYRD